VIRSQVFEIYWDGHASTSVMIIKSGVSVDEDSFGIDIKDFEYFRRLAIAPDGSAINAKNLPRKVSRSLLKDVLTLQG